MNKALPAEPDRAVAASPSRPTVSPVSASIPSAAPGHWDSLAGCHLAQDYAAMTRGDLTHGAMTDFSLANRLYMASRDDLDLIAWQTAAKERIRWLSVQLALAQAIETRRAETEGLGAKHESAVPKGCAQGDTA